MNTSSEKPQKTKTSPYEVNKHNKTRHDRKQLAINKKYSDSELVLRVTGTMLRQFSKFHTDFKLTSNRPALVSKMINLNKRSIQEWWK